MRLALAMLMLVGRLGVAADVPQQRVEPITPGVEQRVEPITPDGEQRVERIDPQDPQAVTPGTSTAHRALATTGKVMVGVLAAVVSVAVMAASLLLI